MRYPRHLSIITLFLILVLSSCSPATVLPTATPTGEDPTSSVITATASPAPEPVKSLTVCTAALPDNYFLYSGHYNAARSTILSIMQGELINEGDGIIGEIPSEENGGLSLQPVSVQPGQTVVDARGELVVLKAGATVRPSGCRDTECEVTWDGQENLQMDQMVLTFHLTDGLTWSDGVPVTAADSVYSFRLAGAADAPGLKWAEMRTVSYTAADEQTVTWIGKPGFTNPEPEQFFWMPLPAHSVSEGLDWAATLEVPQVSTLPLSFGPFTIASGSSEAVLLTRNPYYYRSDEGLPILDEITLKAIGEGAEVAVNALADGTCDVLDTSFGLENDFETVSALQSNEAYTVILSPTGSWEQLVFGIKPASYDEYFNPLYGDRPNFFGDARTRQAVALCLDREAILSEGLSAVAALRSGFLPENEAQTEEGPMPVFDPSTAMALLESVGWRDHDLNPETPLQAWEVAGVPTGTDFSVTLLADTSGLQQHLAGVVQQSLGQCGIEVNVDSVPIETLYAPGPEGLVFGRQFDLSFIAWQSRPDLDCGLYQSWQIPSDENRWIGTNVAGLADDIYDDACSSAMLALPNEYGQNLRYAEEIFLDTSAAIPLISINHILVIPRGCEGDGAMTAEAFFSRLGLYDPTEICP